MEDRELRCLVKNRLISMIVFEVYPKTLHSVIFNHYTITPIGYGISYFHDNVPKHNIRTVVRDIVCDQRTSTGFNHYNFYTAGIDLETTSMRDFI